MSFYRSRRELKVEHLKDVKIIQARNPQLIPMKNQLGLKYSIALHCLNHKETILIRSHIDPDGKRTRAQDNFIYIIQGNENYFEKDFPAISKIFHTNKKM